MIKTEICDLLKIKYPIFQGAMAWIAEGNLAGHVSKAGGLGIIAGGGMPSELLREEIRKVRKITDNPFAVNLMLMMDNVEKQIEVCIEEKVPVVTTGAGNPGAFIKKLKKAKIKVIPIVPSVALAKRMEKSGADAIIVEGVEAGGHVGELTTMALLPQITAAVDIPVIGAGGIATGKQFVAALALGAKGVQVGTRFLIAEECTVHENYKKAILKAKDRSTVVTGRKTGHPVRIINNKLAKEFIKLEESGASNEELEKMGAGRLRAAAKDGDINFGSVMSGQVAAMVNKEETCEDIILDLINSAENELNNLKNLYL
ncbi:2-nitropropane dioxygenase [Haliovirga abyssi]|uniref:2-nitropropane dioxygenase n=1 Tax=Haliovirga abyssi TaxID=2996794 RepID=A0AAU9DTB2_9FUSO|nr:enoyl-[acyl-carrier-protein] reductase FabK [Haliovirga abyssi]BDU50379.1 2-nitropropane dioxygenase [Haliovirga abyssi]